MNVRSHLETDTRPARGRPKGKGHVQDGTLSKTLDRGLDALELIADRGSLTLSEAARALDCSLATTHRMLRTLVERNLLVLDLETQLWSLGAKSFAIGQRYVKPHGLFHHVHGPMEALVRETCHTSILAIPCKEGVLVAHQCLGNGAPVLSIPVGTVWDSFETAHSQVLLSAQTKVALRRLLKDKRDQAPNNSVFDPQTVQLLQAHRVDHPNSWCTIASPVNDTFGHTIAALGLCVPNQNIDHSVAQALEESVHKAASVASMKMGTWSLKR